MINIYTISNFRERIQRLLKVKRGVYAGVKEEIDAAFRDVSMSQILSNRDMILAETSLVVVKLRLPDHRQRLSKSNGYRLIYMAYKTTEKVILLDIYPKRGPLQQITISDNQVIDLLRQYTQEAQASALAPYN